MNWRGAPPATGSHLSAEETAPPSAVVRLPSSRPRGICSEVPKVKQQGVICLSHNRTWVPAHPEALPFLRLVGRTMFSFRRRFVIQSATILFTQQCWAYD